VSRQDRIRSVLARWPRLRLRRPTSRRGAVVALAQAGALVVGLSIALAVGGYAFSQFYGAYGFHPEANARTWAALTPQYADSALCQQCHAAEYVKWTTAQHAGVTCESCHGPLAAHAGDPVTTAKVEEPAADLCITCHGAVQGRPAAFPQIVPVEHYQAAMCTACHDPHTTSAAAPPAVVHSRIDLPACTTCHGPDGLKSWPAGHVPAPDPVCLGCHAPQLTAR
jgi:hypothetical protein